MSSLQSVLSAEGAAAFTAGLFACAQGFIDLFLGLDTERLLPGLASGYGGSFPALEDEAAFSPPLIPAQAAPEAYRAETPDENIPTADDAAWYAEGAAPDYTGVYSAPLRFAGEAAAGAGFSIAEPVLAYGAASAYYDTVARAETGPVFTAADDAQAPAYADRLRAGIYSAPQYSGSARPASGIDRVFNTASPTESSGSAAVFPARARAEEAAGFADAYGARTGSAPGGTPEAFDLGALFALFEGRLAESLDLYSEGEYI